MVDPGFNLVDKDSEIGIGIYFTFLSYNVYILIYVRRVQCSPVPPRSDPVPQRQAGSSFCRHTAECSDDSVSDIWGSSVLLHWTDLVELAPI